MPRAVAVACLLLALPGAAAVAADEASEARAARFFAAGLELPLLELRRGALLADACAHRMRRACSREQRRLAAGNRTLALLDELTLFPQRPAVDATAATSAADLRQKIGAASAALLRTAGEYDLLLIARYGAALSVCPGDSGPNYRESLDALADVDLREFLGLDGADYDQARAAIGAAEARAATDLRVLPPEDCAAVLTVGQLMMELMNGKLEPWTHEYQRGANAARRLEFDAPSKAPADETPTRDLAVSVAGNFVAVVATELQLRVYPETAPRIKAIADAEGAGPG
jgi:hypothetical protein